MATTTLLQRHAGEGETIAEAIRDCLDYGKDPEKTESGKYISAYECDPATVADEFLLAKASYAAMTGREQKKENNVLCYQIRQSFYPGEITPKEANRIGYELAMRWTKGRHAFIVTTHTDKQHIHCHIYYAAPNRLDLIPGPLHQIEKFVQISGAFRQRSINGKAQPVLIGKRPFPVFLPLSIVPILALAPGLRVLHDG